MSFVHNKGRFSEHTPTEFGRRQLPSLIAGGKSPIIFPPGQNKNLKHHTTATITSGQSMTPTCSKSSQSPGNPLQKVNSDHKQLIARRLLNVSIMTAGKPTLPFLIAWSCHRLGQTCNLSRSVLPTVTLGSSLRAHIEVIWFTFCLTRFNCRCQGLNLRPALNNTDTRPLSQSPWFNRTEENY